MISPFFFLCLQIIGEFDKNRIATCNGSFLAPGDEFLFCEEMNILGCFIRLVVAVKIITPTIRNPY